MSNPEHSVIEKYYGKKLASSNLKVLQDIESILDFPIPYKKKVKYGTVGYNSKNNNIITLSLTRKNPVSRMWLRSLPPSIENLTRLENLFIYSTGLKFLPENIGKLINLKQLKLGFNRLTSIPESIGNCTKLEAMNFEANELETLPKSITKLKNLKFLYLEENDLSVKRNRKSVQEIVWELEKFGCNVAKW